MMALIGSLGARDEALERRLYQLSSVGEESPAAAGLGDHRELRRPAMTLQLLWE
jgi:hypothetical protein